MYDIKTSCKRFHITKKHVYYLVIFILLLFSIWVCWGNVTIKTTHIDIYDTKIPGNFKGFVIAQVSDLHNAEFGQNQSRLLQALKESEPDIIAVTGDLIDSKHTDINIAMEFINGAVNIAPTYFVTGNHEAWSEKYEELRERLLEAGVTILQDASQKIEINSQFINLIGLDDPDFILRGQDKNTVTALISQKLGSFNENTAGYNILLSHRPEMFEAYCDAGINIVICGHAHGGQFRIPFLGGVIAPDQGFLPKYTAGCYEKEGTQMIVSRGLGNSIIPIRINNRPELVVVTLK